MSANQHMRQPSEEEVRALCKNCDWLKKPEAPCLDRLTEQKSSGQLPLTFRENFVNAGFCPQKQVEPLTTIQHPQESAEEAAERRRIHQIRLSMRDVKQPKVDLWELLKKKP